MVGFGRGKHASTITSPQAEPPATKPKYSLPHFVPRQVQAKKPAVNANKQQQAVVQATGPEAATSSRPPDDDFSTAASQNAADSFKMSAESGEHSTAVGDRKQVIDEERKEFIKTLHAAEERLRPSPEIKPSHDVHVPNQQDLVAEGGQQNHQSGHSKTELGISPGHSISEDVAATAELVETAVPTDSFKDVPVMPALVCERPLVDNPHIITVHGVGDRRNADISLATTSKLSMSVDDFERQCDNAEGVFDGKNLLHDAKLPEQLNRYIVEDMLTSMQSLDIPQQMFVGPKALETFNVWCNRIYKQILRKSVRSAPRRAQVGDSIAAQVSMRFLALEVVAGQAAGIDRLPDGYLINTFRDNSSFQFSIGNARSDGTDSHENSTQLPWLAFSDKNDRFGADDNDDDFNESGKNSDPTIINRRIPHDHQTVFQSMSLAAASMREGEYSRFLVQIPTAFKYGPFRVAPDSWLEIELLITEITPMGSLIRVLAAPLPSEAADGDAVAADGDGKVHKVDADAKDLSAQNYPVHITFKDLQDAVEMGRRECRTLFAADRWKEALFVCWRLRDHITRFHIKPKDFDNNNPAETGDEMGKKKITFEQRRAQKDALLSDVYVNISRCLSKINDFAAAIEAADVALSYRADNINAMFMSVRTQMRAGSYDRASAKLHAYRMQLPSLLNDNEEFIKLARDLDHQLQLSKKDEQAMCRRMLNLQAMFSDECGIQMVGNLPTKVKNNNNNAGDAEKTVDSAVMPNSGTVVDDNVGENDDELTKQIAARVERKFVRRARQILMRFYDNPAAVCEPWPPAGVGGEPVLSLDEAQYVQALNMQLQKERSTTKVESGPNAADEASALADGSRNVVSSAVVEVELNESSMNVGKFLVMLRKK